MVIETGLNSAVLKRGRRLSSYMHVQKRLREEALDSLKQQLLILNQKKLRNDGEYARL